MGWRRSNPSVECFGSRGYDGRSGRGAYRPTVPTYTALPRTAMRSLWPASLLLAIAFGFQAARADESATVPAAFPPEQIEFFEKEIRPLFVEHCHKCHGGQQHKGSLRLDSRAGLLKGGDTGPAIVPGKPDGSLLIDAVSYGDLYQMPPTGKLADKQIAALRRWVELGAPWTAETTTETARAGSTFNLVERAKHWCFQPLAEQALPKVNDRGWPRCSSDVWILSRLEASGLAPVAPAEKATLLRRATFDLIGLPPTPPEIADFLADERPDAFARAIDRLLASPHFGERWGRHWLDLVRYAESKGHEFDYTIPNAWQYRDYVIRALNADVPYDQFVVEHVAGDLLESPRRNPQHGFNESVLGTGFWFLGEEIHSPVDLKADELDRTDNKIDVFSKTFLGLTVACARCHDHKFDAITTKDYYALAGFIASSSYRQVPFDAVEAEAELARRLAAVRNQHRTALLKAMHSAIRPTLERVSEFLLAATDVIRVAGFDESPAATAARSQAVESVAASRHLSSPELMRWVDAVRQASADTSSPLHLWATIAAAGGQAETATLLASAIERSQHPADQPGMNVLVDFGHLAAGDWRQDGLVFGGGPVKPGEMSFGSAADRPIVRVWDRPAAVSDPIWDSVALAAGVEREPGRLSWLQSGRTIRTPSFELKSGKLFYLVSGSGYAYAAVHAHRMNNGPLHGALIREWQGGDRFQWIEHNLSAYRGERVHIEFSPRQPGETKTDASPMLAIAQVLEADRPPDEPSVPAVLAFGLSDADLATAQSLAAAYQRRLTAVAEQIASGRLSEGADAAVADWLLKHLDLFAPAQSDGRQVLSSAAQSFVAAQAALAAAMPKQIHTAPAMFDGSGVDECVMLRGNPKTPGELVSRRFLEVFDGMSAINDGSGSGRLALARQMTDPARPLAARVAVNRAWQHLFGRGIVASVDNFGVLGERPTHPRLLDELTRNFMLDGWSLKRLIRRVMLSATYQLASHSSETARQVDPQNLLLSHASIKRLEAEAIRDSVLAVSGRLDPRMFGPSVPIFLSEFLEGRGRPPAGPLDGDGRRSIYLSVRRNFLNSFFQAFDYPVPFTSVGRRSVSNVPAQALTMMNSPFVSGEARRWAERILRQSPEVVERLSIIYLSAFGRLPSDAERESAVKFVAAQARQLGTADAELRAWADLCHVLLNAKEFIFVE